LHVDITKGGADATDEDVDDLADELGGEPESEEAGASDADDATADLDDAEAEDVAMQDKTGKDGLESMGVLVARDFKEFDKDKSKLLDESEVMALIKTTGLTRLAEEFDWTEYDTDKDGSLSGDELRALADAHWTNYHFAADDDSDYASGTGDGFDEGLVKADFTEFDKDASGLLDATEIERLLAGTGLKKGFNWKEYDEDDDGSLSRKEMNALAEANWKDYPFGFDGDEAAEDSDDIDGDAESDEGSDGDGDDEDSSDMDSTDDAEEQDGTTEENDNDIFADGDEETKATREEL
jgi:hypothetical protein